MITQVYQQNDGSDHELCFCVETNKPLNAAEMQKLYWLLSETYQPELTTADSHLAGHDLIQIGPRPAVETAMSSNAVAICAAIGLEKVLRIEIIRRYADGKKVVQDLYDKMTECVYDQIPQSFAISVEPEKVYTVPLLEEGPDALRRINASMGLGMDAWDIDFYYHLFTKDFKRNPTNVECFQLGQANSEHCRHWFFKGKIFIDGKEMPLSLMDIVKYPLKVRGNAHNSVIAFSDNSSAIKGFTVETIIPTWPGLPSPFHSAHPQYNIIFTAETHNHPTMIEAFRGAETGTGGRIRDVQATGRGGLVIAGTAGYCVGNLTLPGYVIPGEDRAFSYPKNYRSPIEILIDASNGASDYGNKFGEPVVNGFVRSFGLRLPGGERREWVKPIMFTGGIGQMNAIHTHKEQPSAGMLIIQIGGPAYRIGLGGGAASSMTQGQNTEDLDFNSVQRGNAQMAQKVNRVIRACIELGTDNPIVSIHDQGAGGPCNVVTEIVDPVGGRIDIRAINVGDSSMSVLEIWGAEYQERLALLLKDSRLKLFKAICEREDVPCEVLGTVTGDGLITLYDSSNDTTPVKLELEKILGNMPQKTFSFERSPQLLTEIQIPDVPLAEIIEQMLKLPSVGSKGFLVRKVDRSVTGLIAQQQCCGPLHLPVGNVAVCAQSHFGLTGMATANGEQPIKMLLNPAAGARMAVGEMLTNIVWVKSDGLSAIKTSGNWMCPAKLPSEGAVIYDAAEAVKNLLAALGGAEIDGGKDSLSMSAKVDGEIVKAPSQLVISGYVSVPDITKVVTPDLKAKGESIALIDLSRGKKRLGGSAVAQSLGQLGNDCPDVDDPELLKNGFAAIQELIDRGLITAGHDRSDGGLITTIVEMAMAGNKGMVIGLPDEPVARLCNEELGVVITHKYRDVAEIIDIMQKHGIGDCLTTIGTTTEAPTIRIFCDKEEVFNEELVTIRKWWEATSDELELLQMNPLCALQAKEAIQARQTLPQYGLTFVPEETDHSRLVETSKPKIAIIREVGSNGDREMTSAFFAAGFEPWDVTVTDLVSGAISLDRFRGIVFVGGFSYADVFGSGKGWAAIIRSNKKVKKMFDAFYKRPDTFSFGVCNGCQLMALLGWIPGTKHSKKAQPRFVHNVSGRFESNWVHVQIEDTPAIMLKGMAGSKLGIWVAHGEGKLLFPDKNVEQAVAEKQLIAMRYIDVAGNPTEQYPYNPNGSPEGATALCSPDGRHLAMMPHPERCFLKWQLPWLPPEWEQYSASPWLKLFQNARIWCDENSSL
ncbi:MAG TPA: phosphoribosylformylglycinamidine synthase [Candidatus Paceibacterota bacterium]|jgi:phosphoribosylformylglycinamidine synthase|nr:phosphoribosylformylglycinamidine synthase [Candidatus Paceibacterota bacterium]